MITENNIGEKYYIVSGGSDGFEIIIAKLYKLYISREVSINNSGIISTKEIKTCYLERGDDIYTLCESELYTSLDEAIEFGKKLLEKI